MTQHRLARPSRWSRRSKLVAGVAGVVGAVMSGAAAFAASNWVVGLNSGSAAEGQSATINNLTIAATASPAATNLLYPGGSGDVVLKVTNPNAFPVTVTALQLPTNTTYATGYSDSALTSATAGCTSSTSLVSWAFATATTGSSHTLTSPLTVAANGTLTVTMTNDASMSTSAPAACAGTYFSMPSLTGVSATGGAATATTSPATDAWTS
jgi:hypothetical protein